MDNKLKYWGLITDLPLAKFRAISLIVISSPLRRTWASFDVNLDAGNYYLSIDGVGLNDPDGPPDDGYSDYGCLGYYSILAVTGEVDTDPPTPNPATFATAPAAVSDTRITMTATTGADSTGPVQYFFDETSGNPGGTDSGWVNDPVYNDDGLDPDTMYTYTVTMRDSVTPAPNVGTVSAPASATTPAGCTSTDMHIESVVCSEGDCQGTWKHGVATVTIYDNCGDPVPDALVDVTFTGDFNTTIYDVVTNSSGVAVAETWGCVFKPSFTATVIDVTHDTLPHNSNDDVEDNCSG